MNLRIAKLLELFAQSFNLKVDMVKPCLMHMIVQPHHRDMDKLSPTQLLDVKDKEKDLLTRIRQRKLSLKENLVTPNRPH